MSGLGINHPQRYPNQYNIFRIMKQIYLALALLCPYVSLYAAPPVQEKPETFTAELKSLVPEQRIIRLSRHVDSLREANASLPQLSQFLDALFVRAGEWDDPLLLNQLHFYRIAKRGFQRLPADELIAVFDSAMTYFEKRNDHLHTGLCQYYIGRYRYDQEHYGEAFYHLAKALELFDKVGLGAIPDIGKYLHVMALNHYYFRNYEKVVALMQAAIGQPAYDQNLDIQRYNTLALAYQRLNKLDSTIFYFKRTLEVARTWQDTIWVHLAAGNLGKVYVQQGRYTEALPLLMQDYQHNKYRERHPVLARNAAVEIAATWQKLGRQDSTLHFLRESNRLNMVVRNGEPMWKQQRDEQFYITYYQVFHDFYKKQGNTAMAYQYLDSLTHLTNETNLRYNKMTIRVADDRLKIQQHLADIAVQQADKEKISARLQLIIGIVGSLAVIMGLLYYLLRLRHAKDRLTAEKEKIIRQATEEKMKAQLVEANLELQEYMHRLQEKNKLVEVFQAQLDELRTIPALHSPQLDELTNRLARTKLLTLDDWNDFRQRFNRASGGELDQLKMRHRDLTSAEERIYALEKMNVSTGQMAWMLGISPESVRKTKYRLRKKLNSTAA